jgi:hypothetical protein
MRLSTGHMASPVKASCRTQDSHYKGEKRATLVIDGKHDRQDLDVGYCHRVPWSRHHRALYRS